MRNLWYSTSTLIGMMVGVGMFALPYAFYKAGFFVGALYFVLVFSVFLLLHLMMGELVLRTEEEHRFIGYSGKYLGQTMKRVASFTNLFSVFGSLLAYIIIAGTFIRIISGSLALSVTFGQVFFWLLMTIVLFWGVSRMESTELIMFLFLVFMVLLMFFDGLNNIEVVNFFTFDPKNIFLPYGVLMYAFAGVSAVPIMRDTLRGEERKLKKSIKTGLIIAALIYLLFVILGVGVSGSFVSEDALLGMSHSLGENIIFLGALFGFFAISTSYMAYSFYLKQTLIFDLNINKKMAVALVAVVPIALLFLSSAGFVEVVVLIGSVFGGLEGIILVLMYKKAKQKGDREPEYSLKISKFILYFIMLVFVLGIFYELVYNL